MSIEKRQHSITKKFKKEYINFTSSYQKVLLYNEPGDEWFLVSTKTTENIETYQLYHRANHPIEYLHIQLKVKQRITGYSYMNQFITMNFPNLGDGPICRLDKLGKEKQLFDFTPHINKESLEDISVSFSFDISANYRVNVDLSLLSNPKLHDDLEVLLESGQKDDTSETAHTDIVFKVGAEKIKAHKAIICARVPHFKRMFEANMIEAATNEIQIPDTDPKLFKHLLEFVYSGRVTSNLIEHAVSLFPLAHLYDIQDLQFYCMTALHGSDDKSKLVTGLIFAHRYNSPEWKKKCIDKLMESLKDKTIEKDQLDQLSRIPELVIEVMMSLK